MSEIRRKKKSRNKKKWSPNCIGVNMTPKLKNKDKIESEEFAEERTDSVI